MDTQLLSIPVYNHQVIFSIACSLQFYQSCKEPTPSFHQLQFTTTRWFYHKIVLSSFIYQLCTKRTPGFHRLQFSFTSHTRSRHRLSVCGKWTPFLFFLLLFTTTLYYIPVIPACKKCFTPVYNYQNNLQQRLFVQLHQSSENAISFHTQVFFEYSLFAIVLL